MPTAHRHHVVIIGAGFGGITAAQTLSRADVDITIVDKRNYHLFQPLLYQVATAELSPADIAWPIRSIFSRQDNVTVQLSRVVDVDLDAKAVKCEDADLTFDTLIVANGSSHSYFGKDAWADYAPGLKRIVDATEVRRRILMAFERAEIAKSAADRERELTFVVVGAGPTGVELAGAIAELAQVTMAADFRRIRDAKARVILMEGGPRVLGAFPDDLSAKAAKALHDLGVEVRLNTIVEDITADGVLAGGTFIPSATVTWAAGVQVQGAGEWLGAETDRAGRVVVGPDLTLPNHPDVFVIGDAAKVPWRDGADVPGIAPAAKQQGKYAGRTIKARLANSSAPGPFRYRHLGNLATIGRNKAVIDFGRFRMSGFVAWWIWGMAHIYFLIGVRRPLVVALSWLSSYVFRSKGARLITGMAHLRGK